MNGTWFVTSPNALKGANRRCFSEILFLRGSEGRFGSGRRRLRGRADAGSSVEFGVLRVTMLRGATLKSKKMANAN